MTFFDISTPNEDHKLRLMRRSSHKSLVRNLFLYLSSFLIILIGVFVFYFYFAKGSEAVWFDDAWKYRVSLTITHNAEVTDQKVKFDIDTATLITAGKMQSDCGDSRFTDFNGKKLRYYLDSAGGACNTASTDYYVLMPKVFNGTTIVYHYYGNPLAVNGTETAQFSESTLSPSGGYSPASEEKGPSPALYLKFDEAYGTTSYDSSSNQNNATLGGSYSEGESGSSESEGSSTRSGTVNVKIDDAGNPGVLPGEGRQIVQTSGGVLYAFINDGGSCEIWKSSDGSSWTEQDTSDNPACNTTENIALTIDGNNDLHLIYEDDATSTVKYITYDTPTDQFGSEESVTSLDFPGDMAIEVDANNIPHVVAATIINDEGIEYSNRVGGAWDSTPVGIEEFLNRILLQISITINEDNIAEISYINVNDSDLTAAVGDQNDASSFTLKDVDTVVNSSADIMGSSIGIDSDGNTWIVYKDATASNNITLAKHADSAAWTSWTIVDGDSTLGTGNVGFEPSLSIIGKSIFVFYQEDSTDQKIVYDVYDSGTSDWLGETILATPGGGVDFKDAKVRYSKYNFHEPWLMDFLYSDGTDIYWSYVDLRAHNVDDATNFGGYTASTARILFRAKNGNLYAVLRNDTAIEVWMSSDGYNWEEQDTANSPGSFAVSPIGAGIDSTDKLHFIYTENVSSTAYVRYNTFSSGTFGTEETVTSVSTPVNTYLFLNLTIDSNDQPHVLMVDPTAVGSDLDYSNRISGVTAGVWNKTPIQITSSANRTSNITINDENIAEISYIDSSLDDLVAKVGNLNDATSFTSHTVDDSVSDTGGTQHTSLGVDTLTGDTWLSYIDSDSTLSLAKHTGATWTTGWTINTDKNAATGTNDLAFEPILAIAGSSDIYVFYAEDSTDQKIVYDVYDGTNWAGETVLQTPGTGVDFQDVKAKWSFEWNNFGANRIDYLFSDGTDFYWDYFFIRRSQTNIDNASDFGAIHGSNRRLLRSSTGKIYALLNDGGSCEVWQSLDNGNSWSELDSADNPSCYNNGDFLGAIDSNNTIHMTYWDETTNTQNNYQTFNTSTGQFGTEESILSDGTDIGDSLAIAIDSNNIPHMVRQSITNPGPDTDLIYSNRIGGTWDPITVESGSSLNLGSLADITINDDSDIPEISYINEADSDLTAAVGDANNPATFTKQDVDTNINVVGGIFNTSIGIDSSGNTWIGYVDEDGTDDYITLAKHNDADAWSTWTSDVTNSKVGNEPSIAVDGSNVYIFYEDDQDNIVFDKYNGSTWSGETLLEEHGALQDVKARWSYLNNPSYSTYGIDYLYSDATDVYYNRLLLGGESTIDAGEPTWKTKSDCFIDNCLFYDGTDDASVIANASSIDLDLQLAAAVTFQGWIRVNSDGENNTGKVFTKGSSTYLRITNEGSDGYADLEASRDLAKADASKSVTNGIKLNKWHFVAVTYTDDGDDEIPVYIDGKSQGSGSGGSASPVTDSNPLVIGGLSTTNFHGVVDEFKIYNTERSAIQIRSDYFYLSSLHGSSVALGDDKSFISNGLVGWWKLDESSSNAADSSGNAITLTNNSATPFTGAKFANGAELDGSTDFFDAADSATLSQTGSITLSAWIIPDVITGSHAIVGKFDGSSESYLLSQETDEIRMYIDSSSNYQTTDAANLAANTTYHVAGVYDSNSRTVKLYVNGLLQGSTTTGTIPSSIGDDTGEFSLGAEDTGGTAANYFDGHIDDARLYNRALPPAEVSQLYNFAPGLVAYWNFDEGTGTTSAYDRSGNAYHLDLTSIDESSWKPGKYGSGLQFDGSADYATATPENGSFSSNMFSVGVWIYRNTDSGGIEKITDNQDADNDGWSLLISATDKPTCSYNATDAAANTSVSTSIWYHLGCTSDGTNLKVFVNGVLENTAGITGNISETTDLRVAAQSYGTSEKFAGIIDDLRVYNYLREPAKIIEDQNAGHPAPGSPVGSPVGYWKIDEGYLTNVNDSSENNNDLTMSTASWTTAGKFNKAWNGTGSLWIAQAADDADFDFDAVDELSISLWFRSDSATNPSSGADQYLAGKGTITNTGTVGYTVYADDNGKINFGIRSTSGAWGASSPGTPTPEDTVTSISDIYDGNWHHVVATKTGTSRIDLYVDGKLNSSDTSLTASGSLANAIVLRVGDDDSDATNSFAGDIDEVKIFRLALTTDQVKADFNRGQAQVYGALSTDSTGIAASDSYSREYCIPGDTTTCNPPVADWKMEEGSGSTTNDSSGNANVSSTFTGEVSWKNGKIGKGLSFDGTDDVVRFVETTSTNLGGTTESYTVSAWFKTDTTDFANTAALVYKDESTGVNYPFRLAIDSVERPTFQIGDGSNQPEAVVAATVADRRWHQLVGVRDVTSDSLILYLDGKRITSTNDTTTATAVNDDDISVGNGFNSYTANDFFGLIDEVRIYNYARTPGQIAWDYSRGRPVGWWKFDECQGTTANDSAGNSLTGTISAGAAGITSVGDCTTASTMWDNGELGKWNYSLDFDATDDNVSITNASTIDFDTGLNNGFTYASWIYADTAGESSVGRFFDKGTNTYCRTDNPSGSNLDIECQFDNTTDRNVNISSAITTGGWNHVAFSWNNDSDDDVTVYINGKSRGTSSTNSNETPPSDANNLTIGNNSAGSATFDGKIDDVRIYNYELTANQIKTLYNQDAAVRYGPVTGSP